VAGCLFEVLSSTIREQAILGGGGARIELRMIGFVCLIDACFAPLGLLLAHAMRSEPATCLLVLPLGLVMALAARDRDMRIAQAQGRLELLGRERARLQAAVGRLGDALSSRLDLQALADVLLRGSVDALDADAGHLLLTGASVEPLVLDIAGGAVDAAAMRDAGERARAHFAPCQLVGEDTWSLALPLGLLSDRGPVEGAIVVARRERPFQEDERMLIEGLASHAMQAAAAILTHEQLRRQASTDSLTSLGNRRKLATDLDRRLADASPERPLTLVLFDLNGFKRYNDTFGHPAGDAMLELLSRRLESVAAEHGAAYRLGGDEFCALIATAPRDVPAVVATLTEALDERGADFELSASHGAVELPVEAQTLADAMHLADQRMYSVKRARSRPALTPATT
jgi:diguanylate cyclase (GGDEF)-like protein